jgi:hypothetical protein
MLWFVVILIGSIVLSLPKVKGYLGEASVRILLSKLNKEEYTVLNDLLIPLKTKKASQIDHVIISRYGIFVIETKNYKGWIFGDETSKYWTQVIYNRKEKLYNPIFQNYGHIKALQEYLSLDNNSHIYSIVSFSTRATLKNLNITNNNTRVVYSTQLVGTINSFQQQHFTKTEVQLIVNQLEKTLKAAGEQKREHIKNVKDSVRFQQYKINANMCPKCGNDLVDRTGKYGKFKGCSNYPKCRFVVKQSS